MSRSLLALGVLAALLAAAVLLTRQTSAPVSGQVRGEHGPLAGARVRLQARPEATTTGRDGRFRLPRAGARVTAWAPGHLIAGTNLSTEPLVLQLRPIPDEDDPEYAWVDPDGQGEHACGRCHTEVRDEWAAGAHARSATGRRFRNLYDGLDWTNTRQASWGLLAQYPDGAGVCTACHAPSVASGDPADFDLRRVQSVAARGVHCDYCHKVESLAAEPDGLTHGRYVLRLRRPSHGQLFFGPLDDVDRGEDVFSPLYRDSRYCAACHEGVVFGVPVYTTYSEWRDSPAARRGQSCQDCHMKPTGTMTNVAPGKGGLERDPLTLANHRFFAGSHEAMLRACLSVSATLAAGRAEVAVLAEDVGHRVPTGYIDRHLLLVVRGTDASGRELDSISGPRLPGPAGAALAGRPGRLFGRILRGPGGESPAPFWRADPTPVDTRLAPGRAERLVFDFPPGLARLEVRLLYRRFWDEVAKAKGWPDRDLVVLERTFRAESRP